MNQIEFIGKKSILNVKGILNSTKAKKILLVRGNESFKISNAEKLLSPLFQDRLVKSIHYSGLNLTFDIVKNALKEMSKFSPDIIISVGGGSVLDLGKVLAVINSEEPALLGEILIHKKEISGKPLPLVAIPTTVGSGSESTHFAVVYIEEKKHSFSHVNALPNYVILEPDLVYNLPKSIIASSGLDAFTQAIESYWSVNSTKESLEYARKAMDLSVSNLENSYDHDIKALENMQLAANLSGKAINISKTTAVHAISYPLTSNFSIPHGFAVGCLLPRIFNYNSKVNHSNVNDPRGINFVKDKIQEINEIIGTESTHGTTSLINNLINNLGAKQFSHKIDIIIQNDVSSISKSINADRLMNNPVKIIPDDLYNILKPEESAYISNTF
jgi:alcohol dehydrogenase class IV